VVFGRGRNGVYISGEPLIAFPDFKAVHMAFHFLSAEIFLLCKRGKFDICAYFKRQTICMQILTHAKKVLLACLPYGCVCICDASACENIRHIFQQPEQTSKEAKATNDKCSGFPLNGWLMFYRDFLQIQWLNFYF